MSEHRPPGRRRPTGSQPAQGKAPARRPTGAARAAAPPPRGEPSPEATLVCTAGPSAGAEFPLLEGPPVVIGRASENAIAIPDTSVSRRHTQLRRDEEGWFASDLGSGNGTLINGEPVDGETLLHNGDVLTLGDTELTFSDLANKTEFRPVPVGPRARAGHPITQPTPVGSELPVRRTSTDIPVRRASTRGDLARARSSRSVQAVGGGSKKKKVLVGLLAVLVVGGGVAGLVVAKRDQDRAQQRLHTELASQAQAQEQVRIAMQHARDLVREGKWKEAKGKLDELSAINPNYPGVADYLARTAIEIPNQENLALAEVALGQNQLAQAGAALGKVSSDTQQVDRLLALRSKLSDAVRDRLMEATSAANAGQHRKAIEIVSDILAAVPDHRDASVVLESAKRALDAKNYRPPPPPPKPDQPWTAAMARYVDGDVSGALAIADECSLKATRCKTMSRQIRELSTLYKSLESLDARKLGRLLDLDRSISDGQRSRIADTAGTRAANIYYKSASSAYAAGSWGRAMEYAHKAQRADPTHVGARSLLQDISMKAKDLYLRAYQQRHDAPEEALEKFKQVIAMTAEGDEYHEKAKKKVAELAR